MAEYDQKTKPKCGVGVVKQTHSKTKRLDSTLQGICVLQTDLYSNYVIAKYPFKDFISFFLQISKL